MKKKIVLTVACMALGVMMLVTTAFAGVTGNSGYEAYKQALKVSFSTKSFTTRLDAVIKDNGTVLAEASTHIKTDYETMSSVTAIKTKAQEKVMETYVQPDKTVVKDSESDAYYVINHDKRQSKHYDKSNKEEYTCEGSEAGEAIIDALVGNMKNYFSLDEKSDGTKDVEFKLSGSQIPSVVNAITSIGIKESSKEGYRSRNIQSPFNNEIKFEDIGLPKLVDDIRISDVGVKARMDAGNKIKNQWINLTVHGKDAAGQAHEVVISIDMSFSDQDSTTPDTIDLTGRQVKVIDPKEFKDEGQRD